MTHWLLKTEPTDYAYDDLARDKRTVWDGVRNAVALKHIRAVSKGDLAFVYHTGKEKAVIGVAEIASGPRGDPNENDERIVVFDLKPKRRLARPVTLAEIKADKRFADFALVRISRLSVMPVPKPLWDAILKMADA